ncbi:hypothetical protein AG1IA_02960 [Rhizoctonia solani AG-1 IA]|uniref:Uncharacterized protein n=1 Tax=Thanatephorus cucumeris (strain AG1-IA) TaxID=983506 RepID=L8X1W2_THACA|nr:hypothetical protein AG1IA_02960 [Rhizoctonia solani AG-1 IA]
MSHPSSQPKETLNESDAYRSHGQQPRRNSFTPSVRRERPQWGW